jgi:hypothetical protein
VVSLILALTQQCYGAETHLHCSSKFSSEKHVAPE